MAQTMGYRPEYRTDAFGAPSQYQEYNSRTLGAFTLRMELHLDRDITRLTFRHETLDLHFVADVDNRVSAGRDIVSYYGEQAEQKFAKMIRDKFNPPPKPAPKPKYAVSNGETAAAYLTGITEGYGFDKWTFTLDKAALFATPELALEFVGNFAVAIGRPICPTSHIVRVDTVTQTLEKRVATVLK